MFAVYLLNDPRKTSLIYYMQSRFELLDDCLGVSGDEDNAITWCRFYDESLPTMSVVSTLNFNPSLSHHEYEINIFEVKEDITVSCLFNSYYFPSNTILLLLKVTESLNTSLK